MTKYIIKNCENCYDYEEDGYYCEFQRDNTVFSSPCKDSGCLLKQIVEKCKDLPFSACGCGSDILEMLEIQECE